MNKSLITIIIPVYNVEPYIHRCLDSVINQTYKNLEIILIDDGSTDKSGSICDEYKKKDSRIIVIHQKNQGVSAARNAGLDICKGEYISFIDSDDYVDKKFAEKLINNIQTYKTDIAICGMFLINQDFTLKSVFNVLPEGKYSIKQCFNSLFYSCSNKMFASWLLKKERFTLNRMFSEDAELVYKLIAKSKRVSGVGIPLYYYYHHVNSASHIENKVYMYGYYDVDFLSKRLIYFHNDLSSRDLNYYFLECHMYLLKAKRNANTLYKNEGITSFNHMFTLIKCKLNKRSNFALKFPRLYYFFYSFYSKLKCSLRKLKVCVNKN